MYEIARQAQSKENEGNILGGALLSRMCVNRAAIMRMAMPRHQGVQFRSHR